MGRHRSPETTAVAEHPDLPRIANVPRSVDRADTMSMDEMCVSRERST